MLRPPPSSTLFSYTTLFRSNRAGDLLHLVELHVAHQPVALLQRRIVDAVHADVDDHGTRLHHVARDELGLADRDDEDVGLPGDGLDVAGTRVAPPDGGVAAGAVL